MRRKTRQVKVGNVIIGGDSPISIQSMCNTLTKDADKTIQQIHKLEEVGCEIIRVSVPDMESANALKKIKENISIPLVADIHFDYKLALESARYVDKLRINPGNIGDEEKIKLVINEAKNRNIPIRIGVNMGSLEKDIEAKYGLTAKALVESAKKHIQLLEKLDFYNIIIALKASDVPRTIKAYRMFAELNDYPLHLGITEAGTGFTGGIKSAVGIGALLEQGIGDTLRVSLSADPIEEVKVGKEILKSLKLRRFGIEVTACPTCARANFDVAKIVSDIEEKTQSIKTPLNIAVMGCAVNGPGEAKEADLGIVGGKDGCLFYKNGEIIGKLREDEIIDKIIHEVNLITLK
ncbi:MAG: flavodoxin-dependent (E)-4-hydroxy-3-methylbut-2-enyl-diphosphate synthase [Nanoarchaeota archaeon]